MAWVSATRASCTGAKLPQLTASQTIMSRRQLDDALNSSCLLLTCGSRRDPCRLASHFVVILLACSSRRVKSANIATYPCLVDMQRIPVYGFFLRYLIRLSSVSRCLLSPVITTTSVSNATCAGACHGIAEADFSEQTYRRNSETDQEPLCDDNCRRDGADVL